MNVEFEELVVKVSLQKEKKEEGSKMYVVVISKLQGRIVHIISYIT